jgi:hypothetical protein
VQHTTHTDQPHTGAALSHLTEIPRLQQHAPTRRRPQGPAAADAGALRTLLDPAAYPDAPTHTRRTAEQKINHQLQRLDRPRSYRDDKYQSIRSLMTVLLGFCAVATDVSTSDGRDAHDGQMAANGSTEGTSTEEMFDPDWPEWTCHPSTPPRTTAGSYGRRVSVSNRQRRPCIVNAGVVSSTRHDAGR